MARIGTIGVISGPAFPGRSRHPRPVRVAAVVLVPDEEARNRGKNYRCPPHFAVRNPLQSP